jgi:hypothetical protein
LESLPEGLRGLVSLRNVEAVAALPPQAQARLAEAFQAGLKRLPGAVEQLRVDPNTSVADLLEAPAQLVCLESSDAKPDLADLLQQCFPDMPRVSAEALAASDVMDMTCHVAHIHSRIFQSEHLHTDFVLLVLYGLMRQTLERLEREIESVPSLRQAMERSCLPWKPNDWRKQDA